jgi:LacI family transcriptional regulator
MQAYPFLIIDGSHERGLRLISIALALSGKSTESQCPCFPIQKNYGNLRGCALVESLVQMRELGGNWSSLTRRGQVRIAKRSGYTMRDVAGLANVSLSTVSAVVNNKGIVGPELTARVQAAIEAIGFYPHAGARGLRSGRTRIIGLIIQDLTNPFFVEVMRGVEEEALRNGYEVMICNSNDRPDLELRHLNAMHSQRVDGVLLALADSYAAREIPARNRAPVVYVDCAPVGKNVMSVVTDNYEASYQAVKYLIGLGHRRIVVISGRSVHSTSMDRVQGCRKALQEAHLPIREESLQQGDSHIASGYRIGLGLLQSFPHPTAIFTLNNRMALGILQALRELRIPCPEHVSVLSFDDADWAEVFNPSLSAIAQPTFELGRRAMELLLQSMTAVHEGVELKPQQVVLKSSLRIRGSTGLATGNR